MTQQQYAEAGSNYSSLRFLQFGGPESETSTILHADGPCLFSDDGDRAEVHFWTVSQGQSPFSNPMQQNGDDIAIFERAGDHWTLKSLDSWRFETSSSGLDRSIEVNG